MKEYRKITIVTKTFHPSAEKQMYDQPKSIHFRLVGLNVRHSPLLNTLFVANKILLPNNLSFEEKEN